jgi:cysteine desulfurase
MSRSAAIYLDHHATTPVAPRVLDRMLPYFSEAFGNAASTSHAFGWRAAQAVEGARAQVAALVGARPTEIAFTSGATEAINLALVGAARAAPPGRDHIITQVTEHPAVLESVNALERQGFRVTRLSVDEVGRIRLDELQRALDERTRLVSIMLANHEIGTIQPVDEIGALCRGAGALFHCDVTQGVGWQRVDVDATHIDLATFSAHKLYGPKGAGALFVRRRHPAASLVPVTYGGGHERSLRPGTLNVPAIVGFGEACDLVREDAMDAAEPMRVLRDDLHDRIVASVPDVELNGCPARRHPGNLNLTVRGVHGDALLGALPEIACSAGSACASGTNRPSHVIAALGRGTPGLQSVVRFGLGRSTTGDEIAYVARRFAQIVTRLRRSTGARRAGACLV